VRCSFSAIRAFTSFLTSAAGSRRSGAKRIVVFVFSVS